MSTQHFLEQEALREEIRKQKEELNKANDTRLSLEANIRVMTDEKVV
jgi:hypothetical protein